MEHEYPAGAITAKVRLPSVRQLLSRDRRRSGVGVAPTPHRRRTGGPPISEWAPEQFRSAFRSAMLEIARMTQNAGTQGQPHLRSRQHTPLSGVHPPNTRGRSPMTRGKPTLPSPRATQNSPPTRGNSPPTRGNSLPHPGQLTPPPGATHPGSGLPTRGTHVPTRGNSPGSGRPHPGNSR